MSETEELHQLRAERDALRAERDTWEKEYKAAYITGMSLEGQLHESAAECDRLRGLLNADDVRASLDTAQRQIFELEMRLPNDEETQIIQALRYMDVDFFVDETGGHASALGLAAALSRKLDEKIDEYEVLQAAYERHQRTMISVLDSFSQMVAAPDDVRETMIRQLGEAIERARENEREQGSPPEQNDEP